MVGKKYQHQPTLEQKTLPFDLGQPVLDHIPQCPHHLFEQQASRNPDAIALISDQDKLTYHELNSKANQLAHHLQRYKIGPEVIVGLYMKRSPELLIGLLAVLKAGGAFMPLDPTLPAERLSFMVEDASPALILTQEGLANLPDVTAHIPLIFIDRNWPSIAQESEDNVQSGVDVQHLMYIIYTSGSSGKPKGVLIEHIALSFFLAAYKQVIDLRAGDRVLQFVPVVFDPMVEDIFCSFQSGSTLVLRTEEMTGSAASFFGKCEEWEITTLNLPAAFFHFLVDELKNSPSLQVPACIRLIKVGGEKLLTQKVLGWKHRLGDFPRLLNVYGPTETTIAATIYDCVNFGSADAEIPIGLPLHNLQLYVVDALLRPVPVGIPGELCIGGESLARGYLNRPELNEQKFIADPFSRKPGKRLYRTGDLVSWLPDGKLAYHGRMDNQVKIRGFRIELGEIESALAMHPEINQVAVIAKEEVAGEKYLVAYLVAESHKINIEQLRAYLREKLPSYMIPAVFVPLEKLPLTFNGKIDYRALPQPDSLPQLQSSYKAAQSVEEKKLLNIWQQLLHVKEIGLADDFFEMGGHSLLAAKLLSEIKNTFGLKLPLVWIYAHPTISQQAEYLRMVPGLQEWDTLVCIQEGGAKPPLYVIHDGKGGVEYGFQLARFMEKDRRIYGFQAVGLNGVDEPLPTVEAMAAFYVQRLLLHQAEGPYHLAAYSGGAAIAHHMAFLLQEKGKKVGIVAIFDGYPLKLNRFTYQRIGLYYVISSLCNFMLSSSITVKTKIKTIIKEVPSIIEENATRIKLRIKEKQSQDTEVDPSLKILRILKRAVDTYHLKYYNGSILFIRAIENAAKYLHDTDFGWGSYVREVKIHDLPGDHHMLFRNKESAKVIGKMVENHLNEYETKA